MLLLTSREDPLPTVVMEAMSAGVPTIAFEESGGAPDLIREYRAGAAVPLGDVAAMVRQMRAVVREMRAPARQQLQRHAREQFDFDEYAARLLRLACPGRIDVSVVVPSYNYGRFLPGRLQSIFEQSYPVAELIVLDDASTDDSRTAAHDTAAKAGRRLRWIGSAKNSGSVFHQWYCAAQAARSEWIWIAEADDLCEPEFLAVLAKAVQAEPGAVMAFTDSRAIDAEGRALWPDHQAYYRESGTGLLAHDAAYDAAEFMQHCLAERNLVLNASAVLWRRSAMLAALERCGPDLATFTMAGDWRLYAELLAAGGRVVYVAEPLNVHRRHASSVTHRLAPDRHLAEIGRMQRHMRGLLGPRPGLARGQRRALNATRLALAGQGASPAA